MAFVHWTGALCWAGVTNTCTVLIGVPVPHRCNLQVYLYLTGVPVPCRCTLPHRYPLLYRCTRTLQVYLLLYRCTLPYSCIHTHISMSDNWAQEAKQPQHHCLFGMKCSACCRDQRRPQSPPGIKLLCEDVPFPVIRPLAIVTSMSGELNYFIMSNLKKGREW